MADDRILAPSPSPPKSNPSPVKPSGLPTTKSIRPSRLLYARTHLLRSLPLTGDALVVQQKVSQLQAQVKEDQAHVDALTASLQPNSSIADSDDLDVAKAQLQLGETSLGDANEELAGVSGDKRGQIQDGFYCSRGRDEVSTPRPAAVRSPSSPLHRHGTLAGRISAWFDQRSRMVLIKQARADTDADVAALAAKHADFEKRASAAASAADSSAQPNGAAPPTDAVKSKVARMAQAHGLAQMHSIVEDQLETQKQLSAVYAKWLAQVQLQHSIVGHLALQSFAWIAFILLCSALSTTAVRALMDRVTMDRRRLHTLRTITTLAIQIITLGLVLLIIFGAPSQVPTILGLGAAGLTVVFQDFILAFFGWFILMGKNGIPCRRLG